MMGKRKAPNSEPSDGVAVAEDSGSDEVRGPFLKVPPQSGRHKLGAYARRSFPR
jgi:hypothetical protein